MITRQTDHAFYEIAVYAGNGDRQMENDHVSASYAGPGRGKDFIAGTYYGQCSAVQNARKDRCPRALVELSSRT